MDRPTLFTPFQATPDITVLPSYFPIPGLGLLPVNSFVLRAVEPVLVDTGLASLGDGFMKNLSSVINPGDLRWLWLTHTDADHIGNLYQLLELNPELRLITTFLGLGKLSLLQPLPPERVFLLNPGQSINVGDRDLIAIKPPTYDAPETTGFYDPKSGGFFSADCFGSPVSEPVENAAEIGPNKLSHGLRTWAGVDSPWLHLVDEILFEDNLRCIRELSTKVILSSHLPPAYDMQEDLLLYLGAVPGAKPFTGPDQQAFTDMRKSMAEA
jgi:glyoxylase-like metal-dependent hydrolase (beta-lactamase superfamily II)